MEVMSPLRAKFLGQFFSTGRDYNVRLTTAEMVQFFFENDKSKPNLDSCVLPKNDNPEHLKRKDVAEEANTKGISLFVKASGPDKTLMLNNALEQLNVGITHSSFVTESDRIETSKRFANRSAVLYDLQRYDEALKDIEIAVQLGYPFLHKLWTRKANIFLEQGEYQKAREAVTLTNETLVLSAIERKKVEGINQRLKLLGLPGSNSNPQYNNAKKNNNFDLNRRQFNRRTFHKNRLFDHASRSIQIAVDNNSNRGRHIVASEHIYPGDILFDEVSFASILLPDCFSGYCYHCHADLRGYIFPCKTCSEVKYCSETCSSKSWTEYHNVECQHSTFLRQVGLFELATRIVVKAGVDIILKTVVGNVSIQDSLALFHEIGEVTPNYNEVEIPYRRIYSLQHHLEKMNPLDVFIYAKTATDVTVWLLEKTPFFDGRSKNEILTVGGVLLKHLCQLISNAQRLYSYGRDASGEILDDERKVIGSGIYAATSIMNHSCDPNISTNYKFGSGEGNRLIVKATRKIYAGEEVSNSYGVTYRRHDLKTRKSAMKQQYFFNCSCSNCVQEAETGHSFAEQFESVRCFNVACRQSVPYSPLESEGDELTRCQKCSTEINRTKIVSILEVADQLHLKGLSTELEEGYQYLNQSLNMRKDILAPGHHLIADAHDALAKSAIQMGFPAKALPHLKLSLKYVTSRFGPGSNEYGFELRKYAETLDFTGVKSDKKSGETVADLLKTAEECLENYFPSTE